MWNRHLELYTCYSVRIFLTNVKFSELQELRLKTEQKRVLCAGYE